MAGRIMLAHTSSPDRALWIQEHCVPSGQYDCFASVPPLKEHCVPSGQYDPCSSVPAVQPAPSALPASILLESPYPTMTAPSPRQKSRLQYWKEATDSDASGSQSASGRAVSAPDRRRRAATSLGLPGVPPTHPRLSRSKSARPDAPEDPEPDRDDFYRRNSLSLPASYRQENLESASASVCTIDGEGRVVAAPGPPLLYREISRSDQGSPSGLGVLSDEVASSAALFRQSPLGGGSSSSSSSLASVAEKCSVLQTQDSLPTSTSLNSCWCSSSSLGSPGSAGRIRDSETPCSSPDCSLRTFQKLSSQTSLPKTSATRLREADTPGSSPGSIWAPSGKLPSQTSLPKPQALGYLPAGAPEYKRPFRHALSRQSTGETITFAAELQRVTLESPEEAPGQGMGAIQDPRWRHLSASGDVVPPTSLGALVADPRHGRRNSVDVGRGSQGAEQGHGESSTLARHNSLPQAKQQLMMAQAGWRTRSMQGLSPLSSYSPISSQSPSSVKKGNVFEWAARARMDAKTSLARRSSV